MGRLHLRLNREPLEEVNFFKWHRMEDVNGMWFTELIRGIKRGERRKVLSSGGMGINVKKCLHEEVIVPTALYGTQAWGMRSV